jgi:hypothetical protein
MEINKIELIEGCYGTDVCINDESLFLHEYDNRSEEDIRNLKISLINELLNIVDNINLNDLKYIGEIITTISDDFEYLEEKSNEGTCDQCGNWNYKSTYIKK